MSKEEGGNWNPKRFDGQDYSKFRLRFILYIKKKEWHSVLQSPRPAPSTTNADALAEWDKKDIKVQSTLVNAVSDKILDEIQHESTAKGMVEILDSVYLRKTLMMRVLAKKNLLNLRIEEGEDAQDFFSRFEKHISALKDAGEQISSEEKLSYLLIILPDRYAHIIDVLDALPEQSRTVDYVKGKMMFDHCKNGTPQESFSESAALKTQIMGRRENSQSYNRTGNASGNNYRCHRCGMLGHFRKNCRVNLQQNQFESTPATGGNRREVAAQNIEIDKVDINAEVSAFQVKLVHSLNGGRTIRNVRSAEFVAVKTDQRLQKEVFKTGRSQEVAASMVWTLDSGCTDHITNTERYFCTKFELLYPVNVKVADGHILQASFVGDIRMFTIVNNVRNEILLKNVYFAPELDNNLLSFDRITRADFTIVAKGEGAEIVRPDGNVIGKARKRNKLYEMVAYVSKSIACSAVNVLGSVSGNSNAEKWHRLLGHINYGDLRTLCSEQLVSGLPKQLVGVPESCNVCLEGKFSNLSHQSVRTRAQKILEIVHSDVNFVTPVGLNGEVGYVSFIDDYSRLIRVYCIKSKSEVIGRFMHYINTMSNLMNTCVKVLRCDRGTEYLNSRFRDFCSSKGILINPSPSYVHKLNGTAERFHRTILNRARCLQIDAELQKRMWPECVKTAAYLGNRVLANTIEKKTPFEIFFGKRPSIVNLLPYGSTVFVRIPEVKRKFKMDAKAEVGKLVGYVENGYRILINGSIKESPYVRLAAPSQKPDSSTKVIQPFHESSTDEDEEKQRDCRLAESENQVNPTLEENDVCGVEDQHISDAVEINEQAEHSTPSRPVRQKKQPSRLQDYVVHVKLCTMIYTPDSYKEAVSTEDSVKWKQSMEEEIKNLEKNNVWKLVNAPEKQTIIPVKWVYRIKPTGKFKSRLVAVGFRQPHTEEEETYSPVAAMTTLRIILSLACHHGFHIHQMDVECAFLNGDIRSEVYVSQPKGYDTGDGRVYKLHKALYGLRESPRAWYDCFHVYMVELGFRCSDYDACLYLKNFNDGLLGLILYVDDLLIFSGNLDMVHELKLQLTNKFRMTDMGPIRNYLGISVYYNREDGRMMLDQTDYINSLAKKYKVGDMRRVKTPMEKNLTLPYTNDCDSYVSEYRSLIGALLFVSSGTRLDISFSVNLLSRYQKCATQTHLRYALRVLKYLQETNEMKLTFRRKKTVVLDGWADADWAADTIDRKSTGGILIRAFGNPVLWSCRKQTSVARASTYAEYIALADTVSELMPIIGIMKNLEVSLPMPVPIYEDNSGAVILAMKGKFTKRAKHIEVAYNFVAEYVQKGLIVIKKVDSRDQLADLLTKSLGSERFNELRSLVSIG